MLSENFEQIEAIVLNIAMLGLFVLMFYAVRDVLQKNAVPLAGKLVVYLVLFLGAAGFAAKGVIQIIWESQGL